MREIYETMPTIIKGVFFDMDNTLFDFIEAKIAACTTMVEYLGMSDAMDLLMYFLRDGHNFEDWENISDYMKDRGVYSEEAYDECCKIYEEKKLQIKLYPNVKKTLERLRDDGLLLAVVTDAYTKNALLRLKKTNLLDSFDTLVTFEMTGTKKPSPEAFIYSLNTLQILPQHSLFVGDSLRRDIAPAKKIGMITAYAAYGDRNFFEDRSCQADYVLEDISDVLDLVK